MPSIDWNHVKEIGIWGYGKEGRSALTYCRAQAPQATFTILLDTPADITDAPVLYGREATKAIAAGQFDVLVKSPGISLYRPEIKAAQGNGTHLTSVTNLWFEKYPKATTIVVSGTKGKTTVSRLLHHMLVGLGKRAVLAGNVGTPLLDCEPGEDYTVIELSSYQTADLHYAPGYCLFTSLYKEHVPWHETEENYYRDKLRLADLTPAPIIVANGDNPRLKSLLSDKKDVQYYTLNEDYLNKTPLKGPHNALNIAGALKMIEILGLNVQKSLETLHDFQQMPHRLQESGTKNGVLCINDSISTVPETTLAALEAYKGQPIHLILGGTDRGQDYSEFAAALHQYDIQHIYALPENGKRILAALPDTVTTTYCDTLGEAVSLALSKARVGDILLLSPSAPSFGQFENFEKRGEAFVRACGL